MKNIFSRIFSIIIICLFVFGCVHVGIVTYYTKDSVIEDAKNTVKHNCWQQSHEFNKTFSNMEFIVDSLSDIACHQLTTEHYADNREHFEQEKQLMNGIILDTISNAPSPLGLYFTFNPDTSHGWDEIWYLKDEDGKVSFVDSPSVSSSWLDKEVEVNQYYFRAIREGAFWSGITYDTYIKENIISYAKPVYDINKECIGVIGIDILADDIAKSLSVIDDALKNYSAVLNTEGDVLIGTATKEILDSDEYISSIVPINKHFKLALAQPVKDIARPVYIKALIIALMWISGILLFICLFNVFSRRRITPIIQEYEQKDLLLVSRDRQIKLGEMVGSIVHQWKQPLHIMNMALSNLRDDYERDILDEDKFYHYTNRIQEMIGNLSETADDFRNFLQPRRQKERFYVITEINMVLHLIREQLLTKNVIVDVQGEDFNLTGYKNEFDQCIFNLLDNAKDAIADGSDAKRHIYIKLYTQSDESGVLNYYISIENTGEHIDEKVGNDIFDLYFTTKENRDGSGVGLYITKKIIEEHFGGSIYYQNTADGVAFIISFINVETT